MVVGSHLASLKNYVLRLLLLSPSSPSSFLLFFLSFWYWRLVKIQNKLWLMVFPLISYTPFSYRFLSFFLCASSVVTYTRGYSSQNRWPFTYIYENIEPLAQKEKLMPSGCCATGESGPQKKRIKKKQNNNNKHKRYIRAMLLHGLKNGLIFSCGFSQKKKKLF